MSEPAFKRLVAHKMATDAIPSGGGVVDGVNFLLDAERVRATARDAQKWARAACQVVRDAAEPNPWRESTDDEIAEEILRRIATRRRAEP